MIQTIHYPPKWWRTTLRYFYLMQGFKTWGRFLAWKCGLAAYDPLTMETRNGLLVHIPASLRFPFKDIFLHRAYAPWVLLKHIPNSPTVIDLGANAGFFSLFAFHVRPTARCFSFEPMPENFSLLKSHQSQQDHLSWRIFNQAVSSKGGTARLTCPEKSGPATTASLVSTNRESSQRTVEVVVRPLQEIMTQETGGSCDWLKIDVEGSEYDILYSLPQEAYRRIRTLAVESDPVNDGKKNRNALADFLEKMKFDVFLADDAVLYGINRSFSPAD